jgi:hypothetical protein
VEGYKLVDMGLTEEESKENIPAAGATPKGPRFPYGLCISLDEQSLNKLIDHDDMPEVGDRIHFMAFAKVTSVSSNQMEGGEEQRRVELQITEMSFEDENREEPGDRSERRASTRYGKEEPEEEEEEDEE